MRLPPKPHLLSPLGRLVQCHRLANNIGRPDFATHCRVATNTINNLEAGRHLPRRETLMRILQQIRTQEDASAGIELPLLRAPGYFPLQVAEAARRILTDGGLFDAAWAFVSTRNAGAWAMRCMREDVRSALLQAPLASVNEELSARGRGRGLEQMLVLGCGVGEQAAELVRVLIKTQPLQSLWLVDASPLLLHHAERAAGRVADGMGPHKGRRGLFGVQHALLGVEALCADYRDVHMLREVFNPPREVAFSRLVTLVGGALDYATDDWRDLGAAAGLIPEQGDLLLVEHRQAPGGDAEDPFERELLDWWHVFLRDCARELGVKVTQQLHADVPELQAVRVPSSLAHATAEDRVAQLKPPGDWQAREIRLRWRRTYEGQELDRWLAAQGLRLRRRWPFSFGSRCWALYERAPLEERDHEN